MRIIKKIEEKGINGCIMSIRHNLIKIYNKIIFQWFSRFHIDKHSIVLESEGDCSDNAYALFDFMRQNGYLGKYKITWLVDCPEKYEDEENIMFEKKQIYASFNPKTIKALRTCRWFIFDHCNLLEDLGKRDGQQIVNLWHGCGFKVVPYAKKESNIDIVISTSDFFNEELSKVFGVEEKHIKSLGYPRTDYFYKPLNSIQIKINKELHEYNKVILWMPTYRRSKSVRLDEAYFNSYTGLPILESEQELLLFDKYLQEKETLCIFKIHHLQSDLPAFEHNFQNIRIINDFQIQNMGIQLYQFVMLTDALITDYSSIATDYLLLEKPIIYTIDDYDQYNSTRGFSVDNAIDYFAGYKVNDTKAFYRSLTEVIAGVDLFKDERERVKKILNVNESGNSCPKILAEIGVV